MHNRNGFAVRCSCWLAVFIVFAPAWTAAAGCSSSAEQFPSGDHALLLCGEGIESESVIEGAKKAGIEIHYSQFLRRCEPGNREPGVYMVAKAVNQATSAMLEILNGEEILCEVAVELAAKPANGSSAPGFLAAMPEAEARFVDVNGIRTRYFDKGTGPVLLLVHGGQPSAADFNAWEWQQNFDGLAKNFRVIALDRIGQGYTGNPVDLDDYHNYYPLVVEHLVAFIRAMGLERVHLVGHSQGGWPVTRTALDYPDLVASLVIVDSTMVAPASNAANAVRFYIWHQNDLHPADGETHESIRRGMQSFSYTNNNITDQRIERILAISRTEKYKQASDWFNANRMSPAHPSFRALKKQIWDELNSGALEVPTLIVWGRNDPEGSFDAGVGFYEALEAAGTDVTFRPFDNSGHVPYMEYPDEFNSVVTGFASAHP
ncbi:MAG: alpha/beta hydrolase [Gammaproteobacteria bacterium]|jgi:2-hydroxy-6-oxo-6-(2'-carboxyphenyl)-hexa-2,4-dienoate hydrolase|nr:alpha/beta hydrolase [Gammaproteobacteria bacterium]MDP6616630.1 alpha/beta hydrolase [Gammaproteobacteria bacterium]MDP6695230.1 alpha/beta hydrolase [Gammaproteobacteria bacterium]